MSRYTLKYDLYDDIFLTREGDTEYFLRSEIYVGEKLITVKSIRDLMPYYNHVITSAGYGEDSATIYLTGECWPDIMMERHSDPHGTYLAMKNKLADDIKKYDAGEITSIDLSC